jgi:hypothetical protein
VISKRRRLGLFASVAVACGQAVEEPIERRRERRRAAWIFRGPPPMPTEPLPSMDWPPAPGARPAVLAERPLDGCAWPLGAAEEPGSHQTLFCGAVVACGRSYCSVHLGRMFRCVTP